MEWYQLRYFQTVCTTLNLTKASEELAITQPALSRAIAKLEDELGVPLFERTRRGMVLSRFGQTFLPYVKRAVEEIERGRAELERMINPRHGVVSLGFIYTLGTQYIPSLINTFRNGDIDIEFRLVEGSTTTLMEMLLSCDIDLALCSPHDDCHHIDTIPVLNEELYLIVPKCHPLASRHEIALAEVAAEPFVMYKPESGLRSVIERYCQQSGFQPHIVLEGVEDTTIAGLVAANLGIAIVPRIPNLDLERISLIRISTPPCSRTVHMVWRKHERMLPAVQRFIEFVKHHSTFCLDVAPST
ncbi:LysR family transcriptional regulator [Alicyclobacillus kakegawensis]|uniref:LysR family transcriptional regulator n=1 Tax=Alicyclobacillus kakegawensis TaxID=392012 RepID=UPI00083152C1|nr:LysR family transcriptional regulator [Alicyclobacillus kakegawensis]